MSRAGWWTAVAAAAATAVLMGVLLAVLDSQAAKGDNGVHLIPPLDLQRPAHQTATRSFPRPLLSLLPPSESPADPLAVGGAQTSPSARAGLDSARSPSVAAVGPKEQGEGSEGPTAQTYAQSLVSPAQWACLLPLWQRESGWDPTADNPTSTAFGLAQLLTETSTDYRVQIADGLNYITNRYGSPCRAWAFWLRKGWY